MMSYLVVAQDVEQAVTGYEDEPVFPAELCLGDVRIGLGTVVVICACVCMWGGDVG